MMEKTAPYASELQEVEDEELLLIFRQVNVLRIAQRVHELEHLRADHAQGYYGKESSRLEWNTYGVD